MIWQIAYTVTSILQYVMLIEISTIEFKHLIQKSVLNADCKNEWHNRNERTLYPSRCGLCDRQILSMYNSKGGFTVYCHDCWWGDQWSFEDYGQPIDWGRSLIEQWSELRKAVPRLGLVSINSENSRYTNMVADLKDCYLLFASENCENCSYGKLVHDSKDCFDCSFTYDSELCYECVGVRNCYSCRYVLDASDSPRLLVLRWSERVQQCVHEFQFT